MNITKPISIIIPQKTAHELSRILPENTSVELVVSENQILFVFDNIRLYSRLLNGHFPDYRSFFPKGYSTKGVVLRSDLIMALKRINLISKENNYNTRM
jgi:DNA polymerase III subunit beta